MQSTSSGECEAQQCDSASAASLWFSAKCSVGEDRKNFVLTTPMTLARLATSEAIARHGERAADIQVVDSGIGMLPRPHTCMFDETWQLKLLGKV